MECKGEGSLQLSSPTAPGLIALQLLVCCCCYPASTAYIQARPSSPLPWAPLFSRDMTWLLTSSVFSRQIPDFPIGAKHSPGAC